MSTRRALIAREKQNREDPGTIPAALRFQFSPPLVAAVLRVSAVMVLRDLLTAHCRADHEPSKLLVAEIHPAIRDRRDSQAFVPALQRQPSLCELTRNHQTNLGRRSAIFRPSPLGSPILIQPSLDRRRMNLPCLPCPPLCIVEPAI